MRKLNYIIFLLCLPFAQHVSAGTVRLTMYDDGLSCPANCDAHVVFQSVINGTEFAHDPATPNAPYLKCKLGAVCRLCIESGGKQCLEAIYRGSGPGAMTFDFTPAFYSKACETSPPQKKLAAKCTELKESALRLEGRLNCIANPRLAECTEVIGAASAAQSKDQMKYKACIKEGESAFNAVHPRNEQRTYRCAYEMHGTGGPNSKGTRWRRLLPGACRDGTFVGRDGLDCCSGNVLSDGPLGTECIGFYPLKAGD